MFQIVIETIDMGDLLRFFKKQRGIPEVGAVSVFEGTVRNINQGKKVLSLEYECYETLAIKEGNSILQEARNRFAIIDIGCQHRIGSLNIGETAIGVISVSRHRKEAIKACSWVLDQVKSRVPIWKREHYLDHPSQWILCTHDSGVLLSREDMVMEEDFFTSQRNTPGLGKTGMEKLKRSRITVVGVGGLGTVVLQNLSRMGIGTLSLIDHDHISFSNLARQTLFTTSDIGILKTEAATTILEKINPWLKIRAFPQRLTENNSHELLDESDLIIDATDNFETKFLIHDYCYRYRIDLIQSSVHRFEGWLCNFFFQDQLSPCLRCLYPEIPLDCSGGSCAQAGILATTVSLLGSLQANEAVKKILKKPVIPQGTMLIWDLENMVYQPLKWKKNTDCSMCGNKKNFFFRKENYHTTRVEKKDIVIATSDVKTELFPIRHRLEKDYREIDWNKMIDRDKRYVIVCRKGIRSSEIARYLNRKGFKNIFSLQEGIDTYSLKVNESKFEDISIVD